MYITMSTQILYIDCLLGGGTDAGEFQGHLDSEINFYLFMHIINCNTQRPEREVDR